MPEPPRRRIREALDLLGIRRLLLGIHDAAFPALPEEDVGRGSPCSDGAAAFLEQVHTLGFDGVQLGPQGATSPGNPSPYDGAFFSRSPLSLALLPLTRPEWGSLLRPAALAAAVARRPDPGDRVAEPFAREVVSGALAEVEAAFRARGGEARGAAAGLAAAFAAFRARHAGWLERDALYESLARARGADFREWGGADGERDRRLFAPAPGEEAACAARRRHLLARHAAEVESYAFAQFLLHEQHRRLRERMRGLGLALYGDLQVGMSERDAWAAQGFVLAGWLLGAPPSRTNPAGQPWGYPVLDPRRYGELDAAGRRREGPVLRFLRARAEKAFAEYDGVRVDHPHGLVCPWVYRAGPEPERAVRAGTRLLESPDVPELAPFAIARRDQLDLAASRHADGWVRTLAPEQVERYAVLLDAVVETARANGRRHEIACEILSTQPYPLRRVIERHGLGRFRVTQKADLGRPDDVYRGENARPEDWILLGNHDTRPVWLAAEDWLAGGEARRQADHLASRLLAPGEDREAWVHRTASDLGALVQAKLAELFVGPARHVMIFFTDLLGEREAYNRPGTVSPANWSIRVPSDWRRRFRERLAAGRALDVPRALARALRSRGAGFAARHRALLDDLERADPGSPR